MPTAKPRYDSGGRWKNRHYNEAEWEELKERLRKKLRGYYPDKNAEAKPPKLGSYTLSMPYLLERIEGATLGRMGSVAGEWERSSAVRPRVA